MAQERIDTEPEPRPPVRRRLRGPVLLAILLVLVLGLAATGVTLLRMKSDLEAGKAALFAARRAIVSGDAEEAAAEAAEAEARFGEAAATADGVIAGIGGTVPLFGHNVEAAAGLAQGGTRLAAAAGGLADALANLPGGLDALAPSGGRLPLGAYRGLAGASEAALADARLAADTIAATPDDFLLGAVRDARWEAADQTAALVRSLEGAQGLLDGLPTFAGAEGPRRYLVVAQNPAELRGTGGIWGAYAILTLRDGRPTLSAAAPTQALEDVSLNDLSGVDEDYRENYDVFGGAASWQNMNMTPDFPSAARAALANYEAGQGEALDGVLAADPFALEAMLRVTGPVPIPGTDLRVRADDVVAFTMNEAFSVFPRQVDRKAILGAVAGDVIARFLALDGKGLPRIRALASALGGNHLLLYSTDPAFQEGLVRAGAAGAFLEEANAAPGDVAAVTVNNGSANKVDYYGETSIDLRVTLAPEGAATGELEITLTNNAPTEGAPRYVLGPFVPGLGPGDARPLIGGWCHAPCALLDAKREDGETGVNGGTEGGIPWFRDQRPIAAGAQGSLLLRTETQDVWDGDTASGVYRLTYLGQPTAGPTTVRIEVVAPPGTDVVWSNLPMSFNANAAVWEGTPSPVMTLEVRYQAPTLTRWWRTLMG